ncbi:glycoside hydrolase family 28 protein [Reichenbachiella agarivorans]|uniref:Glycoside hydrolase family 28 protein n=1 Tax=Reichenbachiella agarivorans TaxID=2979464 RepID=A0ABY6CSF5_9BACT|nr:glycoside hydrolase family 28 protein [Reichenbachiella agarivorans]UXP32378.1 glycoside hydrolase family 28 protein [Reichenbachiella agarivorans]
MKKDMKSLLGYGLVLTMLLSQSCEQKSVQTVTVVDETAVLYEGLEFDMPKVQAPTFADYEVSIVDFGAVGDGLTENSAAINKAITQVAEHGGGQVTIPFGIWLTGPITLQSNVNLHTERGALVQFSDDFDLYPIVEISFEGLETYRCLSPIHGKNLTNVAITGQGVFDGAGDSWRPVKKSKLTEAQWKEFVRRKGVLSDDEQTWYPSEKSKKGDTAGNFNVPDLNSLAEFEEVKDFLRPVMVSIISSDKVLLDGPTFQNSPAWNLHPLMCENVILRNLTIRNPWYSQNGDGVDLESCKNVLIYNNSFDVGDDAICFKSGKDEDGLKRGIPTENVIVRDNIVYHGHGGFVIGSEMSGGVKNVQVSHCTFIGTDCGLRFKSTRGRGGVVEDIYISDIDMINVGAEAIRFNLFYGGESPVASDGSVGKEMVASDKVEVSVTTPSFKNIYIRDVRSTGSGIAAYFQGLPEMKLKNIQLENVMLEAERGITLIDADAISFKNVSIKQEKGSAITAFNTTGLTLDGLLIESESKDSPIQVYGKETRNFVLSNSLVTDKDVLIGNEVDLKTIDVN